MLSKEKITVLMALGLLSKSLKLEKNISPRKDYLLSQVGSAATEKVILGAAAKTPAPTTVKTPEPLVKVIPAAPVTASAPPTASKLVATTPATTPLPPPPASKLVATTPASQAVVY